MVLKKWLFLLVSAWLINTLVCFHGVDLFDGYSDTFTFHTIKKRTPQNLVLWLGKHLKLSDSDGAAQPEKIKFRYRYLGTHYQSQAIFWRSANKVLLPIDQFSTLLKSYVRRSRFLTSSQLSAVPVFRLTPF